MNFCDTDLARGALGERPGSHGSSRPPGWTRFDPVLGGREHSDPILQLIAKISVKVALCIDGEKLTEGADPWEVSVIQMVIGSNGSSENN